jgi:nucleoside-diphosphate-sugar epimerase
MPEPSMPNVLITGATGALGPCVVEAFHREGFHIRTFSLDAPQDEDFPDDVEVQIGDVTNASVVAAAMRDIDIVVHLAALLHIVDPSPELHERYQRVNVQGTANIVEAALQAGVERVVLFSTIAVYGRAAGEQLLDESTLPQPETMYARSKFDAERIVLAAKRADGKPLGVVLRMAAIYGSRVKGNYRRLVRSLARKRFVPVSHGTNRRTLIYDRDAAQAAVLAAQHPDAGGRVFNVSDGGYHTLREIIGAICAALGRNPPRGSLPVGPVRMAAGILEDTARIVGFRSPVTRATVDKYTEDIAVDSRKIQCELGFVPRYGLVDGWNQAVEEMRKRGDLRRPRT